MKHRNPQFRFPNSQDQKPKVEPQFGVLKWSTMLLPSSTTAKTLDDVGLIVAETSKMKPSRHRNASPKPPETCLFFPVITKPDQRKGKRKQHSITTKRTKTIKTMGEERFPTGRTNTQKEEEEHLPSLPKWTRTNTWVCPWERTRRWGRQKW